MIKSYVISCVGGIIFLTFAEFMAPRGKNGEAVKTVAAIIAVAIIVIPVATFLKTGSSVSPDVFDGYARYAGKIDDKTRVYALKTALFINGLECENVVVEYDEQSKIKSVLIFFDKKVIESDADSINITEKAKEVAAKTLDINTSIIGVEFNGNGGEEFD